MTTDRQRKAARQNIKKAQAARRAKPNKATPRRARAKPGSTGEGEFYHIEVRPTSEFKSFRTQDVGDPGHIERVAGRRTSGSWDTVKWLISKEDAHKQGQRLVADTPEAREVLEQLGSAPLHVTGDRFRAKPRPNIPEADTRSATPAQQRARRQNIKKAQAARRK